MPLFYWVFEGQNRINTIHKAGCLWVFINAEIRPDWTKFTTRSEAASYALSKKIHSAWNCKRCGGVCED